MQTSWFPREIEQIRLEMNGRDINRTRFNMGHKHVSSFLWFLDQEL